MAYRTIRVARSGRAASGTVTGPKGNPANEDPAITVSTLLVAVLLAVIPTLLYLLVLNWIDRYEKEPWTLLLAGIFLGAIVAPIISMGVLGLTGRGFELTPSFAPRPTGADPVVAITEEVIKGLLLLGLVSWVRDEFDDVMDGIVYGAAIGAGFGAGETFLYAIGGVSLPGGTVVRLMVSGLGPRPLHVGVRCRPGGRALAAQRRATLDRDRIGAGHGSAAPQLP